MDQEVPNPQNSQYNEVPQRPLYPSPVQSASAPEAATTVSAPASSNYHSNPFTASLHQLSIILKVNPVSTLTLGFLMLAIIVAGAFASGFLSAVIPGVIGKVVLIVLFVILYLLVVLRFAAASLYIHTASRNNETINAREAVKAVAKQHYATFLLTVLASGILIVIGFIALIIPGLFLMGRLLLAPYVAMNEGLGVGGSLKKSWALSSGHWFEVISAGVASLFLLPNGLLTFVGVQSGLASRYFEISELKNTGAAKPKMHWMNVVLPVILIVGLALYYGFIYSTLRSSSKLGRCNNYNSSSLACQNEILNPSNPYTFPDNYGPTTFPQ